MNIKGIIERVKNNIDCIVYPPNGLPKVAEGYELPEDMLEFYSICGGIGLYVNTEGIEGVIDDR